MYYAYEQKFNDMISVNPVISIIVPVYNSEPYLEECLSSIINQTYRSIEIILINDGSKDRSLGIMQNYSERDDRIVTLSQPNRGVAAARNVGLRVAKGEYILFVDSDDTIRNDTVEKLYRQAIADNAEIVMGNMYFCFSDGTQRAFFARIADYAKQSPLSGEQCFSLLVEANLFPPMVVLYFTKRAFIQQRQLFFEEGIVHEDELWCIKALIYTPKTSIVDFFYYYYRIREGSIMRSDNKKHRLFSYFSVVKALEEFASELEVKQEFVKTVGGIYVRIFYNYYLMCQLLSEIKEKTNKYKKYFGPMLKKRLPSLSQLQQQVCSYYFQTGNKIIQDI